MSSDTAQRRVNTELLTKKLKLLLDERFYPSSVTSPGPEYRGDVKQTKGTYKCVGLQSGESTSPLTSQKGRVPKKLTVTQKLSARLW